MSAYLKAVYDNFEFACDAVAGCGNATKVRNDHVAYSEMAYMEKKTFLPSSQVLRVRTNVPRPIQLLKVSCCTYVGGENEPTVRIDSVQHLGLAHRQVPVQDGR